MAKIKPILLGVLSVLVFAAATFFGAHLAGATPPSQPGVGSGAISASNGNLGVGAAASTTAQLYVVPTSTNTYAISASGNIQAPSFIGTLAASNLSSGVFASGNFDFQSSLGIGYSSQVGLPLALSVKGAAGLPANSGTSQTGIARFANSGGNGVVDLGFGGSSGYGWIQATDATNLATNYGLLLNPNGGNVGIGTTTPLVSLSVIGSVEISNNNTYQESDSAGTPRSIIYLDNANPDVLHVRNNQRAAGGTIYLESQTGGAVSMTLLSNGNVGIGTTNPGQKLEVTGNTSSTQFCLSGSCISSWGSVGGTTTTAANVSAGTFGANVGNGNYTFPGTLTINSTANPGLTVGNGTTGYAQIGSSGWYDDGTYLSPIGARNFYVRSTTPTSYLYSTSIYLGDGASANNVYFRNETLSGTSWGLSSAGILALTGSQTDSNVKAGAYEIQGFAVNNNWSADNLYYSSGWKYRANGYGEQIYYINGQILFETAPSNAGGAGATATPTAQLTIGNTGAVTVANTLQIGSAGGTIQNVSNSYYEVNSMGWYVPNSWVIANDLRSRSGYLYLGASDLDAVQGTDTYLRLNNAGSFTSGVYTPGAFRADGAVMFLSTVQQGTTTFTGNVTVGSGGTGKITAGTVDPVYTIGGQNYATYLPGMTGQKEETTGDIILKNGKYEIDFNNLKQGSDLWLFSKATNLVNNFDALTVLLTPGFDGRVWYTKDSANKKLIIHGDGSGDVSYRLTAPRFDAAQWTNYAQPDEKGFNLDQLIK